MEQCDLRASTGSEAPHSSKVKTLAGSSRARVDNVWKSLTKPFCLYGDTKSESNEEGAKRLEYNFSSYDECS